MSTKNPFSQSKEPINFNMYQNFLDRVDFDTLAAQVYEDTVNKVESHLKTLTPDLLVNFNTVYQELTRMMKDFQKTINEIEKKTKKLFESSSLTEDVYKMRDEMKNIKKKLDKLNAGFRNFSKLSSAIEED